MRIDRPRHGDRPDEGEGPDREPDKPQQSMEDAVARIAKANADQYRDRPPTADRESENRAKIDRLLKLHHGDKAPDDKEADEPKSVDRLPNADRVAIDQRKFTEYSLNADHPTNRGKAGGWAALGFDVSESGRQRTARDAAQLIRETSPDATASKVAVDEYGQRYRTEASITGPNGRSGILKAGWLVTSDAPPKLTTVWAEPRPQRREDPR